MDRSVDEDSGVSDLSLCVTPGVSDRSSESERVTQRNKTPGTLPLKLGLLLMVVKRAGSKEIFKRTKPVS